MLYYFWKRGEKMKRKIMMLCGIMILAFCLTGCSTGGIKEISYQELKQKVEDKETFMLEIVQTGCSACEDFTPRFQKILKENNITAYSINLTNLSEEERTKLNDIANINSTPTVIFYENGEEESVSLRIIGAVNNEKINQKLKTQGYIK